jgi:hypothetical protein
MRKDVLRPNGSGSGPSSPAFLASSGARRAALSSSRKRQRRYRGSLQMPAPLKVPDTARGDVPGRPGIPPAQEIAGSQFPGMQLSEKPVQFRPEILPAGVAHDAAHLAAFIDQNESWRYMNIP